MSKPALLWIGPVMLIGTEWYELLSQRERLPVRDLTKQARIDVEILRELTGCAGVGVFPSQRSARLLGVRFAEGFGAPRTFIPDDVLSMTYTTLATVTMPNNSVLTGAAVHSVATPSFQRAMAASIRRSKRVGTVRSAGRIP